MNKKTILANKIVKLVQIEQELKDILTGCNDFLIILKYESEKSTENSLVVLSLKDKIPKRIYRFPLGQFF